MTCSTGPRIPSRPSLFWASALGGALWLFLGLAGGTALTGCSEFNRALKAPGDSAGMALKQRVARKYFDKRSYDRAIPLLEEMIMLKRGTSDFEEISYLHAKSHYLMKDYTMASYFLENYVRTFPAGQHAEECAFLDAICYNNNSPNYELDQTDTRTAIDRFQLFLVRFPNTSLRDSTNNMIDLLRSKLEVKAYHAAEQYFHMRQYQGASMAFKEFMRQYPNSDYREDAMLRILRADHALALNSIETKRADRIQEALRAYRNFADAYPASVERDQAERLRKDLEDELEKTTKTTPVP
ncbi:MAG: outer membrane protein assembly factor BamD [Flavobacteriales bacterium]|nr:outer membrane protein assembly factor BamD [Flavobacteriales bacterium]